MAPGASASPAPEIAASGTSIAAITAGHPYRHGAMPTVTAVEGQALVQGLSPAGSVEPDDGSSELVSFGGGIDGVGVVTGQPKVYLVLWGSPWGTESVNGSGYDVFSGDPDSIAPDLEAFYSGLGTDHDSWSGIATQYCEGVATGSTSCPTSAAHVAYPSGGVLAGVWEDTSEAPPQGATAHAIALEAVSAAEHFGNTTAASNRDAQYVIVSPHGYDPDEWLQDNFCGWHDYTGDASLDGGGAVSTPWSVPIAFTNLPYIPDAGGNCGDDFVNAGAAGTDDGVTIVAGHEYAETDTDQFPGGGWLDAEDGEEVADQCAWLTSGAGAAQDITLATGTFPVQGLWANDAKGGQGGCEISHVPEAVGVPSQLAVTSQLPSEVAPGQQFSVSVTAQDFRGATASTSDEVDLAVQSGPQASPSCTQDPVVPTGGVATFSCSLAKAGSYTLYAYDASTSLVSQATTGAITVPGPATPVITSAPSAPTSAPAFTFTAPGAGGYECMVDDAGFTPCTSPKGYSGLAPGAHTFYVATLDGFGNVSPAASDSFTVPQPTSGGGGGSGSGGSGASGSGSSGGSGGGSGGGSSGGSGGSGSGSGGGSSGGGGGSSKGGGTGGSGSGQGSGGSGGTTAGTRCSISLSVTRLVVRHGRLAVTLKAHGSATVCSGRLVLVSQSRRGASDTTLAQASYAVREGKEGTVTLSLGHVALSALGRAHGRLTALLLVDHLSPAEAQAKETVHVVA